MIGKSKTTNECWLQRNTVERTTSSNVATHDVVLCDVKEAAAVGNERAEHALAADVVFARFHEEFDLQCAITAQSG